MTTTPLPPLPEIDDAQCIPYQSVRYVAGFTKDFVKQYAQAYATQARADLEAENKSINEMNDQLREQNTSLDAECARLEAENAKLREALKAICDEQDANEGYATPATYDAAYAALEFVARHKSSDWPERCQQMVDMARAVLKEQP